MSEAPRGLLADPMLGWPGKAAAAAMWAVCKREDDPPTFWETFADLAERLGCTARQARRSVWQLVDAGWVVRDEREPGRFVTVLLHERRVPIAKGGDREKAPTTIRSGGDRQAGTPRPRSGQGGDRQAVSRSPEEDPKKTRRRPSDSVSPTPVEIKAKRKPKADERKEKARAIFVGYEEHRGKLWPNIRGRQPTDRDLSAIVKLADYVSKRRGCSEAEAWGEIGAYGQGALDHAKAAERGETDDREDFATKIVKWRSDGGEWGSKRYDVWAAEAEAPRTRRVPRGPINPSTQNHDEDEDLF